MKTINKFITNNLIIIVIILLLMQPFLDVFTAIMINVFNMNITIGGIVRSILLLFYVYYLFFLNENKDKKKMIIYSLCLFAYLFFVFGIRWLNADFRIALFHINDLVKMFYFPIVLMFFYSIYQSGRVNIAPSFIYKLLFIYLLFIFVPNIIDIGFESYEITKIGSVGFFFSANEISAIISILMPIFLYHLIKEKKILLSIVSVILLGYSLVMIGTKGPLLSLGIIVVYLLFIFMIKLFKQKMWKKITVILSVLIIGITLIIMILPRTPFYKNIVTHLEFLEVTHISEIFTSKEVFDHFIFSQRLTFLSDTHYVYKNTNLTNKLIGIGTYDTNLNQPVKMIEMDYFDVFYHAGVIGFTLFMIPFVMLVRLMFKTKKCSTVFKVFYKNALLLSIILIILLSLITGHVLIKPAVSIYVALILNMFYNELKDGSV